MKKPVYRIATNELVLPLLSGESDIRKARLLFNTNRLAMLGLIHREQTITVADLMRAFDLGQHGIESGLEALERLGLIRVSKKTNPGHGRRRVITCLIPPDKDCFNIRLALESPQEP